MHCGRPVWTIEGKGECHGMGKECSRRSMDTQGGGCEGPAVWLFLLLQA